jgi:hypothetical protein
VHQRTPTSHYTPPLRSSNQRGGFIWTQWRPSTLPPPYPPHREGHVTGHNPPPPSPPGHPPAPPPLLARNARGPRHTQPTTSSVTTRPPTEGQRATPHWYVHTTGHLPPPPSCTQHDRAASPAAREGHVTGRPQHTTHHLLHHPLAPGQPPPPPSRTKYERAVSLATTHHPRV